MAASGLGEKRLAADALGEKRLSANTHDAGPAGHGEEKWLVVAADGVGTGRNGWQLMPGPQAAERDGCLILMLDPAAAAREKRLSAYAYDSVPAASS